MKTNHPALLVEPKSTPAAWPGKRVVEGRTIIQLPSTICDTEHKGPLSRKAGDLFYNNSISGSRTRSVLLMQSVLSNQVTNQGSHRLRLLDAMTASGVRGRRWLNECKAVGELDLQVTFCDIDPLAIEWAASNHRLHPPASSRAEVEFRCQNLFQLLASTEWDWIDIDPFGSPRRFIGPALLAAATGAVMEISATDSAALTGSAPGACLRRYGAKAVTDWLAHDTGLRILLGRLYASAASLGRSMRPLLSIWDSHHLRVSIEMDPPETEPEQQLGWRVKWPSADELAAAQTAGLHPLGPTNPQPSCLLPLDYPLDDEDSRVSGPLWVGPMAAEAVLEGMTEELALEFCAMDSELSEGYFLQLEGEQDSSQIIRESRTSAIRAVRYLADEASLCSSPAVLIAVDDLTACLPIGGPPSPRKVAARLREMGFAAAQARYANPAFRTNADWDAISQAVLEISPPAPT